MRRIVRAVLALPLIAGVILSDAAAETLQIDVNGRARTSVLERPAGQGPRPTLILLHGFNGSGADIARRSGLDRLAPQRGWVAAFPDRDPGLQGWNFFPPGKEPAPLIERGRAIGGIPDDVAFLKQLINDLVRRGISDPKRVFLAGLSNGSFMTLRMICADAVPLAGMGLLVGGMPDVLGSECRAAKPVPALMINGSNDQTVPYRGGPVQPGGIFSAWPTERLVGFFRELNGCAGTGDRSSVPGTGRNTIELNRSTKCARAPVAFYRVVGGDHGAAWEANFGPALLDFFREQTRDEPALAARPAPTEAPARPQAAANAPFSNIAYRRQDGPTLVTGTLRRISAEEWLETNTRGSRWTFSTTTENESEIVLYDISRDTHVRADLPAQKLYVRKGTSPWAPLADIVRAEK